jgi:hypothetical protein
MKVSYLIVDGDRQLRKVKRSEVHGLWQGQLSAADLGGSSLTELRLISVLRDRRLRPRRVYLLRLPLTQGRFTEENYLTLQVFAMPDCVTPLESIRHHGAGWPTDFVRQLAVVLDVPVNALRVPLGIGGPLFTAAALRVSPREALRYLR